MTVSVASQHHWCWKAKIRVHHNTNTIQLSCAIIYWETVLLGVDVLRKIRDILCILYIESLKTDKKHITDGPKDQATNFLHDKNGLAKVREMKIPRKPKNGAESGHTLLTTNTWGRWGEVTAWSRRDILECDGKAECISIIEHDWKKRENEQKYTDAYKRHAYTPHTAHNSRKRNTYIHGVTSRNGKKQWPK